MAAKKTKPVAKGKAKKAPKPPAKRATSRARERTETVARPKGKPRFVFGDRDDSEVRKSRQKTVASLEARGFHAKRSGGDESIPDPPGPESKVDQRVEHCWLLMSRGLWRNYATRVELSAAWGVADTTIRDYAAEASRRLRLEPEELDAAKVRHRLACEDLRQQALTTFNEVTGMPDFGAALKATELAAKFEGVEIDAKQKIELTGKDGGPITTAAPAIMLPQEIQE